MILVSNYICFIAVVDSNIIDNLPLIEGLVMFAITWKMLKIMMILIKFRGNSNETS